MAPLIHSFIHSFCSPSRGRSILPSKRVTTDYDLVLPLKFTVPSLFLGGPGSSVGIATDYGGTVRGSNPGGVRFFAHVQPDPGAHPAPCTLGTGYFPGVKRPGRGADHPPPSTAEVENE
jgi:hypothetical protein